LHITLVLAIPLTFSPLPSPLLRPPRPIHLSLVNISNCSRRVVRSRPFIAVRNPRSLARRQRKRCGVANRHPQEVAYSAISTVQLPQRGLRPLIDGPCSIRSHHCRLAAGDVAVRMQRHRRRVVTCIQFASTSTRSPFAAPGYRRPLTTHRAWHDPEAPRRAVPRSAVRQSTNRASFPHAPTTFRSSIARQIPAETEVYTDGYGGRQRGASARGYCHAAVVSLEHIVIE